LQTDSVPSFLNCISPAQKITPVHAPEIDPHGQSTTELGPMGGLFMNVDGLKHVFTQNNPLPEIQPSL
jgi:hypothetical protein